METPWAIRIVEIGYIGRNAAPTTYCRVSLRYVGDEIRRDTAALDLLPGLRRARIVSDLEDRRSSVLSGATSRGPNLIRQLRGLRSGVYRS